MSARVTVRTRVHRFDATGEVSARADRLAGEEPLEIRLDGEEFTVAMRTPGHDVELVHGLLLAEAIITRRSDVREIDFASGLGPDGSRNYNVARVRLDPGVHERRSPTRRQVYTSSACGICGTASIEAVEKQSAHPVEPPAPGRPLIDPAALLRLPERLRAEQSVFDATGGVHAAALFRVPGDGRPAEDPAAGRTTAAGTCPAGPAEPELLVVREDVGRHNAVDKVIGWALAADLLPLHRTILQVSGRASFELVQKAAMAGIPVLSAVSAPSALAVDLARDTGLTVAGFNRGRTFNAYSCTERIGPAAPPR